MDTRNNSQNFPSSPTTNDINAANQAAQNPTQTAPNGMNPASGFGEAPAMAPVPTWLPPAPALAAQQPAPPMPAPTSNPSFAPVPDPTAWPSAPQDHGGASSNNGWNPTPAPTPPQLDPQPETSPMNSAPPTTFGNSVSTSQPATSSPSWTPPPVDQGLPIPPGTPAASPVSTTPSWSPPAPTNPMDSSNSTPQPAPVAAPVENSSFGVSPIAASAPAWTPPAPAPITNNDSSSSVFPPQFQQPSNTPAPTTSFDPLAATPTQLNSSSSWPTPPTDQSNNGFATPQPPVAQAVNPAPVFAPSVDNQLGPATSSYGTPSPMPDANAFGAAPTVPDFINNPSNQSPVGMTPAPNSPDQLNTSYGVPAAATPTPDANPTDLSSVGTPANNSVYTPTIGGQEPIAPVAPSGIPETVANVNKPKLSKMLVIIGVVAILMVIASASYLLFFSSKSGTPEDTISLPASGQAPLTKPKAIVTPTPTTAPAVVATSSASPSTSASPSATGAGSAFDLLKQSKTSPSPSASPK